MDPYSDFNIQNIGNSPSSNNNNNNPAENTINIFPLPTTPILSNSPARKASKGSKKTSFAEPPDDSSTNKSPSSGSFNNNYSGSNYTNRKPTSTYFQGAAEEESSRRPSQATHSPNESAPINHNNENASAPSAPANADSNKLKQFVAIGLKFFPSPTKNIMYNPF